MVSFLRAGALGAIRFYQRYLSPLKGGSSCRFEPSCSAYALGSFQHYHPARALVMSLIRLAKCGPWHPGGYDPVP
ncbi:membrane protein insertion efficiency factor YidD [Corynebacterium sp. ES2730-CONJ]|uniref:membrane protein insertion efficiency factor YidD n=1 Tax=Corynebacterium sp. ES2730-CONJ TaxID=2973941 RepID=UPI00216B55DD|nr:membrane protein insertion efficiency factor YidD [Corynebacterium sp. ES2730-CONJ]MCS4532280.1 membrane protein insertion efficiency factor YidD [Corynebacterium sp. ES2730-CONJ]